MDTDKIQEDEYEGRKVLRTERFPRTQVISLAVHLLMSPRWSSLSPRI